jgi:glycosyltransferase involved in cell wall biosynthesis
MTIIFLTRRFYPKIGGVEKHVLEISKRLVKKGHRVIVITEKSDKTYSMNKRSRSLSARLEGKIDGVEIHRIDSGKENWFKKFRIWSQLWRLRKLIVDAEIIHCHDVFFWYFPFRLLHPTKKVYTTFHGYEGNKIPNNKAIFMHKLSEKLSKGNICVGGFLKKWYGTKPTFVTYGAVDSNCNKTENLKFKITKNNRVIFLGRLEKETGILEYLKALNALNKKSINLTLDVYGDGTLKKESINYSKDHNLNVSFNGFVSNASEYIKNYEYVFCSRYLGILEAMIFRKPIFSEYNNEIKKDYLLMSPFSDYISISKDAEEICRSVEDYMNRRSKINTEKAYNWVKSETWEKMVDIYLKLWR